jgi:hypothetical protein
MTEYHQPIDDTQRAPRGRKASAPVRFRARLAWRPSERPAAKQVEVEMEDRLARAATVVHNHPVSRVESEFLRKGMRSQEQVTKKRFMLGSGSIQAGDVLFRNHQNVGRGLRIDVAERQRPIILLHNRGRALAADYSAEQAIFHARPTLSDSRQTVPNAPPDGMFRTRARRPRSAESRPGRDAARSCATLL